MEITYKRKDQLDKLHSMDLNQLTLKLNFLKKKLMLLRMKKSDIKDTSQFMKLKKMVARVGFLINKKYK